MFWVYCWLLFWVVEMGFWFFFLLFYLSVLLFCFGLLWWLCLFLWLFVLGCLIRFCCGYIFGVFFDGFFVFFWILLCGLYDWDYVWEGGGLKIFFDCLVFLEISGLWWVLIRLIGYNDLSCWVRFGFDWFWCVVWWCWMVSVWLMFLGGIFFFFELFL